MSGDLPVPPAVPRPAAAPAGAAVPSPAVARDPYARLARGCRPRGCRAPARRVHGRRVRYVIGDEPGQVNGMRWRGQQHEGHVRERGAALGL